MSLANLKKLKNIANDILVEKEQEFISTGVGTLNILFGGGIDKGIPVGKVSMIAADSSLGKSIISLKIAKNAQKKNKNVILFDTEKAYSPDTAKSIGIDPEKIIVIQNTSLESVMSHFMSIMKEIEDKKDEYIFIIDSWNVLVSSKTIDDVSVGKDVVDMTTSKKKNSFSKLLLNSDVTVFVVNQIYSSMDAYSLDSIPGGKGIYFASSSIVQATSKAKDKSSDGEIQGAIITAQTRKGRYSKEHSKLKYLIKYDGGLNPYYGLLDIALETGLVTKPSVGWYQKANDDKKYREKDIYSKEFFNDIIQNQEFKDYVSKNYSFKHNDFIDEEI